MSTCQVSTDLQVAFKGCSPPRNGTKRGVDKLYAFLNDEVCHLSAGNSLPRGQDDINYSQAWFTHYKRREHLFKPWSPTLGSINCPWESLRVQAINNLWRTAKNNRISPITIHLGIWLMNKLLYSAVERNAINRELFATTVAVAFRTALKFEERPEALWSIRRIWEVLPMFDSWSFDRSDQHLMKIESDALRSLNDCLDAPLSVQFFDKFVAVGGWPAELSKEYVSLGHFLLALATFTNGDQHPLINVSPSKLAAAAVVLSVKIVNGDSRRSYEFYPERFAAFCQMTMKELQPAIKGLSSMLRKKPEEASVLSRVYPEWGEHEWQ